MRHPVSVLLSASLLFAAAGARGDFESDAQVASQAIRPIMPQAEALMIEGKFDEANAKVMAIFPEKTRTAAQAFTLGNVLYRQDPRNSYALHKRAAAELPDEAAVHLEWGMEQHRAGEYGGAADSYEKFAKANPNLAPVYAFMAECLIRTGKIAKAADSWKQSEDARQGTLEQMESWVCEVNGHQFPHQQRADLLKKAQAGDIDAARRLIALDADFPRDWWNGGVQETYMKHDLAALRSIKFKDAQALAEVLCVGDTLLGKEDGENVAANLKKGGLLLDANETLPQDGGNLSLLLAAAFDDQALTKAQARAKWGTVILDKAKATKNADFYNVAANLYLKTGQLSDIDRAGWEATGDVRFAASYLAGMAAKGTLKLDDPALVKAAKQFPEDAIIAAMVLDLTQKAGKPLQPALVAAIKAEYSHFSPQPISLRPGAATLRTYFAALRGQLPKI